jgi:DNA-binding response OmpR family regulator
VLIAEDDAVSRRILETSLRHWGYQVVTTVDGDQAWRVMSEPNAPHLAILDIMMPGVDGLEICRRVRQRSSAITPYIILLTAKHGASEIVKGIEAGADDYLTKPYDRSELRARVRVGVRMIDLQINLADRVEELEDALEHVKQLQGILPICSYCKKIRDDHDYWQTVESYIANHSEAEFSHGICPACYETAVRPQLESMHATQQESEPIIG